MKVDGGIGTDLHKVAAAAEDVEAAGYSGAWTVETAHDPFLPLAIAAEHTSGIELGTSIAVAFARNPMTLANLAWDLGHLTAEVDGTNPRAVLHQAKKVFEIGDADERIEAFKGFVEAGATVAAHRAQTAHMAGDPMPATVENVSRSVAALMEVERNPRPSLRRAATRALFGR